MTNRQKQAMETRKMIISKGKEMVIESGIENFTIDELAQACGVAKGTFYHYFKTKDDFVIYLVRKPYMDLEEQLKGMRTLPIQEQMCYYVTEHTKLLREYGIGFTRQYYRSVLGGYVADAEKDTKIAYDMKTIEGILRSGVETGQLKEGTPVRELAEMFFAALCGRSVCWCVQTEGYDPEVTTKNIFKYLIIPSLEQYRA